MSVKKVPMDMKTGPYIPYFLSQRDCGAWYCEGLFWFQNALIELSTTSSLDCTLRFKILNVEQNEVRYHLL